MHTQLKISQIAWTEKWGPSTTTLMQFTENLPNLSIATYISKWLFGLQSLNTKTQQEDS